MRALAIALILGAMTAQANAAPQVVPLGTFLGTIPTVGTVVSGNAGTFLLDTGGGVTTISPRLAKAMGCTPWGDIVGFRMRGDRLDMPHCDHVDIAIGKRTFTAPQAAVFDINSLAPKDAPQIDGVVALDLFADQAITIEPAANRLTIETPASLKARTRHLFDLPIRIVRDAQGVALTVDLGVPTAKGIVWMEMDTGNDDTNIPVSKAAATALGLDPDITTPQPIHVQLAPGIVIDGKAHVVDKLIMDGSIPLKFLKAWAITFDLKHGKAWLAPAKP
ncbi:MAG: aspartyl protease family protein [Rhizomicrobium sp.]